MLEKANASEKKPRMRGNMICFLYIDYFSKTEPLFAIGPHWKKSILFILLVNILVGVAIGFLDH